MDGLQEISDLIQALDYHQSHSLFNNNNVNSSTRELGLGLGVVGGGSENGGDDLIGGGVLQISEISLQISTWTSWTSSVFLLLVSLVGLPLNGATVAIFWRRKKLRSLVNFELLLDCLSHIILCLICIPIHVVTSVWKGGGQGKRLPWSCWALLILQQVVGSFANLFGLLLTLSISILRYRRLCWKKKDKFSTINAIKWSGTSGALAIGLTLVPCFLAQPHHQRALTLLYSVKLALVLISILAVFFCYMRVIQRVWSSSGAKQEEKVMDATKLKKSRIVRMLATFHSCVQIVLVMITLSPYLYKEAMEALKDHRGGGGQGQEEEEDGEEDKGTSYNRTDRLLAITINYTLLILGTPLAYIASCHRFREQFTSSILFIFGHSPSTKPLYLTRQSTAPSTQQQQFRRSSGSQKSSILFRHKNRNNNNNNNHNSSLNSHNTNSPNNNNNYCPFHYNFSRDSSLVDKKKRKDKIMDEDDYNERPEVSQQQQQQRKRQRDFQQEDKVCHSRIVEIGEIDDHVTIHHGDGSRRKSFAIVGGGGDGGGSSSILGGGSGRRGSILDSLKPLCNSSSDNLPSSSSSSTSSSSDHTLDSSKSTATTTNGSSSSSNWTSKSSTTTSRSSASSFSSQNHSGPPPPIIIMGGGCGVGDGGGKLSRTPGSGSSYVSVFEYCTNSRKNFCQNLKQEYHKTIMVTNNTGPTNECGGRSSPPGNDFGQIV